MTRETDHTSLNDCWNTIGVWARGEKSCPELKRHSHCVNCAVFAAAGRRLLQREAPPGYLAEWAKFLSAEQQEREHNTLSVIVFRLADEWLALPTRLFDEIVSMRPVHRVPHRNSPILRGITNIRGELQVCVSLGQLLHITRGDITNTGRMKGVYERMAVVAHQRVKYVFPVSEVHGVHRYSSAELKNAPATAFNCHVHYLQGMLVVNKHPVGVLDHELLLPALERGIA